MKKALIILSVIAILGVGGYFGLQFFRQEQQAAQLANYQTQKLVNGDLTTIIGTTGTVHAEQTTILTWQTSGRIDRINVTVGDRVEKGDMLAELDQNSLPQNVILAQSELISAQNALRDLQDSELAQKQAYQAYVNAQDALETAINDRNNLGHPRASQETIDIAKSDYILAQDTVNDLEKEYDNYYGTLLEDDPIRAQFISRLASARKIRDQALAKLNWYLSEPDQLEIEQAEAKVEVAQATLVDARREWERLQNGVDPNDIVAAEARIAAIEATLSLAKLEAPISGIVTDVMSKVGDDVSPGTPSFRIDDLSRLLVDVDITEVDINSITVGQTTKLTFDAILGQEYFGEVIEVGRIGTTNQGVVNFNVTIQITNADDQVRPGMTAAVTIITSQLDNVLLVPNRAVRLLNGQRVIYLLKDGKQQPVVIQIGASSDVSSQIVSGDVKVGDLVILNPRMELDFSGPPEGVRNNQ